MRKNLARVCLAGLFAAALGSAPALAGGSLDAIDITGFVPSPIPGQIVAKLVPIRWDARCIPVRFRVNNTLDPIPNPLGAPFLSIASATPVIQDSFNQWNQIKTSYIDMELVGTNNNPGLAGFDMKNELTFRPPPGFGAIAVTPTVTLIADSNLVDGDDIDGDGVSDVSSHISSCAEIGGHTVFPAGFYKAGTILDADIIFNTSPSTGLRFTIGDAAVDTNPFSVDLKSIVVHESGHAHGLSHVLNNQIGRTDGNGSTMFPFVNSGEPASEIAQRSPAEDDIAWSSFVYPEGTAGSGPAALQPGDIAFDAVYGLVKGSVTHGILNQPILGASVFAQDFFTGNTVAATFSGHSQISVDPNTGDEFLISPDFDILDGKFTLPLRLGLWKIGVDAADGTPFDGTRVNLNATLGVLFGQQDFPTEYYNGSAEAAVEVNPGAALPLFVFPGTTQNGVKLVTNNNVQLGTFGALDFIGFTGALPGSYYAVRFPVSSILAVNPGKDVLIQEGLFRTIVVDNAVPALFGKAVLATGSVSGTSATIDLAHPLWQENNFLGRDNDEAPFFFPFPDLLGGLVRLGAKTGAIHDLFLVLQTPNVTPFPGINGLPPVIGLDGGVTPNDVPISGTSYTSNDGVTWTQVNNFNFMFSLVVSKPPAH
jgi:hypothetical protein